jgi:uncharacterized membrane protein
MRKLSNYFINGLLVFVPVALTIFLIIWVFTTLDATINKVHKFATPGLGLLLAFVLTFIIITFIGVLVTTFLGKKLFGLIDRLFTALPLVRLLYASVKDLIGAFAGDKKGFHKPVIVSVARGSTAKIVGFMTRESLENFGLEDYVAVYIPQSYNFAGNVMLFPKESVTPLNIEGSKAMAFIVSGGVSGG